MPIGRLETQALSSKFTFPVLVFLPLFCQISKTLRQKLTPHAESRHALQPWDPTTVVIRSSKDRRQMAVVLFKFFALSEAEELMFRFCLEKAFVFVPRCQAHKVVLLSLQVFQVEIRWKPTVHRIEFTEHISIYGMQSNNKQHEFREHSPNRSSASSSRHAVQMYALRSRDSFYRRPLFWSIA